MFDDPKGPIEHFEWGQYRIRGELHSMDGAGEGKDIFLSEAGVQAWAARKGHKLRPAMVDRVFPLGVEVLVIGCGVNGALKVLKKTRKAIKEAGVDELIVVPTPEACRIYNRFYRQGRKVALLAHGTC